MALIGGGGQGVLTAVKNREPLKMTFAEYAEKRPSAEWVSLSDAQLNLLNIASTTSTLKKEIERLYIAVEPVGDHSEKPAIAVLETRDPKLISVISEMKEKRQSGEGLPEDIIKSLFPPRQINGLARSAKSGSNKWDGLAKQGLSLTPEIIIISDGKEPNLGLSIGLLVTGLILGFLMLRSKRKPPAAPAPPDLPAMR